MLATGKRMRRFTKHIALVAVLCFVTVIRADTSVTEPKQERVVAPSVEEMRTGAERIQQQNRGALRDVLAVRETARQLKDVIKLNCVNDRLVQLKAQMNIADEINLQLQPVLAANDPRRVDLYAKLQSTAEAVEQLRSEAMGCVGEAEMRQESGVLVDEPDMPDDPIQGNPFDVFEGGGRGEIEPPAYASPFN